MIFAEGRGVPQDKVLAYALLNLSAMNDGSAKGNAIPLYNRLLKELTPREIDDGQQLSRALAEPGKFGGVLDARMATLPSPRRVD